MVGVASFLSSLGVNTHMDAAQTGYANAAAVANQLAYIGFKTIRDHAYDTEITAYQTLGAAGISLDLIVDTDTQHEVATMLPVANLIKWFEGSNEVDYQPVTAPGVHGNVASAIAVQARLLAVVRATPQFANVPIINESLAWPGDYTQYIGALADANLANTHLYSANGDTPQTYIVPTLQTEIATTAKPTIVTETGYYTLPNNSTDPSGVDESVQARLTLDTLFDNFKAGAPQTYLYELLDEGPDPLDDDREMHYGLFHTDGSPKLAATALHNLTTILSDPATPGGTALNLAPTFSGLPATGSDLTLSGPNGSEFVAVWAEPAVWDQLTQHELPVSPATVTIHLGATVASLSVFDPLVGTAPIATALNQSQIVVTLSDHPLIVELTPAANPAPTPPVPPPAINAATVNWTDTTTGAQGRDAAPAANPTVASQYQWTIGDNVSLAANVASASLQGGAGTDALHALGGSNVLDGGAGSSFLVGATGIDGGSDQFFADARGATPTWSTIVHFHNGDQITLWGFQAGVSTLAWAAAEGAAGYTGATIHSALAGTGTQVNASLTLAGLSLADVTSKVTVSTGSAAQTNYLRLTYTG